MEKYQSCFCCTGHEWFLEQVEWLCYQESISHPINFEATLLLLTVGSYHVNMGILLIEPPPPQKKKTKNYSEAPIKIVLPLPHKKLLKLRQ